MVYGQSLPLQFPLDVDASYHAAGLAKGEDLFNKEDLSQFQASGASHNISQHIATYPYAPYAPYGSYGPYPNILQLS